MTKFSLMYWVPVVTDSYAGTDDSSPIQPSDMNG